MSQSHFNVKIMCGRFSQAPRKPQQDAMKAKAPLPELMSAAYNVAPTQRAWVQIADAGWQALRWGLVPHWSKSTQPSGATINARIESVMEKPTFRDAVATRRCVVPADSFYEWRTEPGGRKVPYRILNTSGELLWLAGIWDHCATLPEDGRTFSVLTTEANADMALLHSRMPLLLDTPEKCQRWLAEGDQWRSLLEVPPAGLLRHYRVSEKLNKVDYDGPDLHDEVPEPLTLF
jgi:putative SOS response-associated peptidase YedK